MLLLRTDDFGNWLNGLVIYCLKVLLESKPIDLLSFIMTRQSFLIVIVA